MTSSFRLTTAGMIHKPQRGNISIEKHRAEYVGQDLEMGVRGARGSYAPSMGALIQYAHELTFCELCRGDLVKAHNLLHPWLWVIDPVSSLLPFVRFGE